MATCCIHCGVEEGELHLSNCPEMRGAFERLTRERDEAIAECDRLRGERDELKAVVLQIVDRIVPLTPVVLAAISSREGE